MRKKAEIVKITGISKEQNILKGKKIKAKMMDKKYSIIGVFSRGGGIIIIFRYRRDLVLRFPKKS
jgi:hypothetical protein